VEGTGLAAANPTGDAVNYWVACAVMAGFAQGGGVGLALSEWMVHGSPTSFRDIFAMDVARFGGSGGSRLGSGGGGGGEEEVSHDASSIWASKAYTLQKAQENYRRRFRLTYPNEELPAARGVKTSPLHARLAARGAVFGASYGLEYAKYYARGAAEAEELPGFRRSNAFGAVQEECRAVRERAGLIEMSGFSKFEVGDVGGGGGGGAARRWLEQLLACRVPRAGKLRLAPMLGEDGFLMGDLTVLCLGDGDGGQGDKERFMLLGSGYLQAFHMRHFKQQLRWLDSGGDGDGDGGGGGGGGVEVRNVTDERGGLSIAGPLSHALLERLVASPQLVARGTHSSSVIPVARGKQEQHGLGLGLPFMGVRELEVGMVPCTVARVSVTGELGYEITTAAAMLPALHDALLGAAAALEASGEYDGQFGEPGGTAPPLLQHVGSYALNALRLEKSFGVWSREFTRQFTPRMAGLERFVHLDSKHKGDFVGKAAALRERDSGAAPPQRLVTLDVDVGGDGGEGGAACGDSAAAPSPADAWGYEPVWHDGKYVGFTTSGAYGHHVRKSLAMAYVDSSVPDGAQLTVHVLGEERPATMLSEPAYDPSGAKMRDDDF
jgi:dimethylglycine dehydrogenase